MTYQPYIFWVLLCNWFLKELAPPACLPAVVLIPEIGTVWGRRDGIIFSLEGDYFKFRYDILSWELHFPRWLWDTVFLWFELSVGTKGVSVHPHLEAPWGLPFDIKHTGLFSIVLAYFPLKGQVGVRRTKCEPSPLLENWFKVHLLGLCAVA